MYHVLKFLKPLSTRSSFQIDLKMQSSITRFFKLKQPPKDKPDEPSEAISRTTPVKRLAEDDDEDVTSTKRQAVEASQDGPKDKSPLNELATDKEKQAPTASKATPVKMEVQPKKTLVISPLIDMNVVIRKTKANGAFALNENIGVTWFRALQGEFNKAYFKKLSEFVQQQRQSKTVYPPEEDVYTWTHHHDIRDTRVVILGQDPYHGPNQAHGLSFSVRRGVYIPPSLVNIFKELKSDIPGFETPDHGDLTGWAKQGVLMLNTCLTVNKGEAFSHKGKGWETFTTAVISWISKNATKNIVFLLWGRPAQQKANLVDKRHLVLKASHPSPLSAHTGFYGCQHFSKTNDFLKSQDLAEIDWKL